MLHRGWFPESITGERVALRRHVPANLAAYRRWYGDPEVARLIGYRSTPMPAAQIDRFFQARAIGPDALALAIHIRTTERLVGTCAFSQLDGDNGSALFHITIGEKDAWGQGYGREATELMLEHAFSRLRLHRVALSVFAFNERAIRAYDKAGFVLEGRSRESIWRDGRYWDELQMSVLEAEWQVRRDQRTTHLAVAVDGIPAGFDVDRSGIEPGAPGRGPAEPVARIERLS
jgi:RimJ/RimL family protein N-acetyltransferase